MQQSVACKVSQSIAQDLTCGAVAASSRLVAFEELWPSVFKEVISDCTEQMTDMDRFMRVGMRELLS